VGLKQGLDFEEIMREVMQQSHHCGIETSNLRQFILPFGMAAIAPLWD